MTRANFALQPNSMPQSIAYSIVETVRKLSGISIDPENAGFLELRINRRVRELGLPNLAQYLAILNGPKGQSEANHLVEMLATHTTDFFREPAHYRFLEQTGLPSLIASGAGKEWPLTVWSAACSLGSELWSAAMVIDKVSLTVLGGLRWSLEGTDISRRILRRAESGVFSADEISGIPEALRQKYLLRGGESLRSKTGQILFRIDSKLRQKARFQWANLVAPTAPINITADVIFLRNVLIYFEPADQQAAVATVLRGLRPGGYLFIGHSEQIGPLPSGISQVAPAVFRKGPEDV
jgi:chemotaxis protein methyltransferase CheR